MNDFLNWFSTIFSTATPVLAETFSLLLKVPMIPRIVLILWLTWIFYLSYTSLERAHKMGRVGKVAMVMAVPLLIIFWPLDVLVNIVVFSLLLWEIPRELTITQRLGRHHRESSGYRHSIAKWFGAELLDPFDADGHHIDPDPRAV